MTTGRYRFNNGNPFIAKSSNPGCPDILGVLPGGRALAIEVKRKGGKPTCQQEDWLKRALEQGAIAFVATSIEDVKRGLSNYFATIGVKL